MEQQTLNSDDGRFMSRHDVKVLTRSIPVHVFTLGTQRNPFETFLLAILS